MRFSPAIDIAMSMDRRDKAKKNTAASPQKRYAESNLSISLTPDMAFFMGMIEHVAAKTSQSSVSYIGKRRIRITGLMSFVIPSAYQTNNDIVREITRAHIASYLSGVFL